jgi:hypothetical protein
MIPAERGGPGGRQARQSLVDDRPKVRPAGLAGGFPWPRREFSPVPDFNDAADEPFRRGCMGVDVDRLIAGTQALPHGTRARRAPKGSSASTAR